MRLLIILITLFYFVPLLLAEDIPHHQQNDPPLVFYSGAEPPFIDMLELILQSACLRIGKTCILQGTGSAQRALIMANEEGDGDVLRAKQVKQIVPNQTTNLILIPESIIKIEFYVYSKKAISVSGWPSLKPYHNSFRIGIQILEKMLTENQTVLPDADRLFQMLEKERVDTVIEQELIGDYILAKNGYNHMYKSKEPIFASEGFMLIHKKHQYLVPLLIKSLSEMKTTGEFTEIKNTIYKQFLLNQAEN